MRTRSFISRAISALALFCAALAARTQRQFELKAESPKSWELIAHDSRLEKVAGAFRFTEGAVWDPYGFGDMPAKTSGYRLKTKTRGFVADPN